MQEPAFKPEVWVTFQQDTTGGFGKIIGAHYDGTTWQYTVSGSSANGELHAVREDEVTLSLQNGSWMAPSHIGGGGSVYTDTTPSI